MNVSIATQRAMQAQACARGVHDPGLALKALLNVPRGSAYNSNSLVGMQPDVRVKPFLARACRGCGVSC